MRHSRVKNVKSPEYPIISNPTKQESQRFFQHNIQDTVPKCLARSPHTTFQAFSQLSQMLQETSPPRNTQILTLSGACQIFPCP